MLKVLYRSTPVDGTVAADTLTTNDYVGGCPAGIDVNGVYGTLSDTHYAGVLVNARAVDINNGNASFYAGVTKMQIWQGLSGTDPEVDTFCPFDTSVTWAIGSEMYIRNMTTYAIWSSVNYNQGVSHGFVTAAPASATGRLEAWMMERGNV